MRMKNTKKAPQASRAPRSTRSKHPVAPGSPAPFAWTTRARAAVFAMMFVLVAAAVLTTQHDAPPAGVENAELALPLEATRINTTPASVRNTPPEISTASMAPAPAPKTESVAAVTISGCLEVDEGTLRLTDASGADTPTSRSWKSGFLKKRPAEIELADAVGTLHLRNHVGRRVAATGTLVDRELRARSVRVGRACD